MAWQKFRDFRRFASVTVLLPAFLTINIALNAQNPSDTSKLRQSLGLASGKAAKSSDNFNRMAAAIPATPAALATTTSATLPKFIAHRDYLAADGPVNLAMGDLNGDGIADLVVPNFNSTNISVLKVIDFCSWAKAPAPIPPSGGVIAWLLSGTVSSPAAGSELS